MPKCAVLMAKIEELKFKLIDHLQYLLDLAPSDLFLFPNVKKMAQWTPVHVKRGGYHLYKRVF